MDYNQLTKAELVEKLNEQKHLAQAVEAKDKEIVELKQKFEAFKTEHQGAIKKADIEKYVKDVQEEIKQAQTVANYYIRIYRDFLKQTQQNLEMAILTEELVSEKIPKKRGE
jgi:Ca2+-binding EF-hand superfamily protein